MDVELTPTAFALTGRNRSLGRLKADAICFFSEGIELRKGRDSVGKWAWGEIRSVRYTHWKENASGLLMALGGNWFAGREAGFLIAGPEEKWDVVLEFDSQYRKGDLRRLFREMYLGGVELHEFTSNGLPAFLLEPLAGKERSKKLEELRA